MPFSRMLRLLAREALVPLLCAVIVLSGVAQARTEGGKFADPAATAQLFTCGKALPDGGDGAPPDHDCADCCLPGPVAAEDWRIALPFRFMRHAAALPEAAKVGSGRITTEIPWSRGPPATA